MDVEGTAAPRPFRIAPLAPIALAAAAGIALDRTANFGTTAGWAWVAFGCALACGLVGRRSTALASALIGASFVAIGAGWHHHRWSDLAPDDLARGLGTADRPAWVRGLIVEAPNYRPGDRPRDDGATRLVLALAEIRDGPGWRPASGRAAVIIGGDRSDLAAGERVAAAGRLGEVDGPKNPGEFSLRDHLHARDIRLRLDVDDPSGIWPDPTAADPRSPLGSWIVPAVRALGAARSWSLRTLRAGLGPGANPLAEALLLGRRDSVAPDVDEAFARTGTTHLLAISGLHLQVLALVFGRGLRAAGLSRRRSWGTVALATLLYAGLVGLAPSVVRSAAMTATACLATIGDRQSRPSNAFALAALVTFGLNPASLFDIGCQLSFLAVAALVWLVPPTLHRFRRRLSPLDLLERRLEPPWKKAGRWVAWKACEGLIASTVVWLAALPLVAIRFHAVAPIGILLNLPLIPLTSAALLAAGLTLALGAVGLQPCGPPAWACRQMLGATEQLVRWGASRSWGHAFEPGPPAPWVVAFYAGLALATLATSARSRWTRPAWWALLGWSAIGVGLAIVPRRPDSPEVDVLAVEHGLAVAIQGADGRAILYDCGRLGDPRVGRRIIAPALWSRGLRRLDMIILSHADADHYGGLPDLLDRFAIGEVRIPPGFDSTANPGAVALCNLIRSRRIPLRPIAAGDRIHLDGTTLTALHPPPGVPGRSTDNARSVVLDLEIEGRHLLLTGDLEADGLVTLISAPPPSPRVDALLAPHHGGRSANPDWFYDWARPALVIASQRPPQPGASDALELLERRKIPVLRTWQRGAIRLRPGPTGLEARGFLDGDAGEGRR